MTPDEKSEWWADLIACTVAGLLVLFVLLVHKEAFTFSNQPTPKEYLPEQIRMLGKCPVCHLVKQPADECGEFKGWLWEECQDVVHRYPDGD